MKTKLRNLILLFGFVFIHDNLANATSYSRSGEFPPLKLTYDDMRTLLQRIHAILTPPETRSDNRYTINKLTIADGKLRVDMDITDDWEINEQGRFPKVSFDLRYQFYDSYSKVEKIDISFSDYSRKVSVQGTDPNQVDSAYDSLTAMIKEHTTWIGGSSFRAQSGALLACVGLLCFWVPYVSDRVKAPLSIRWTFIIAGLGLLILVTTWTLPYDRWLPGFAIYAGPLSFAERYSSQITLIGLLLGLPITIILGGIPFFRSRRVSHRKG